jgi:hypothetical protein
MDTNSNGVFAQSASGQATRCVAVIGVIACFTVTSFAAVVGGAGVALSTQADVVSVDRTHKGDRSRMAPKPTSAFSSPFVITMPRPPIGCESAFSGAADPKRSHVFGRCIS